MIKKAAILAFALSISTLYVQAANSDSADNMANDKKYSTASFDGGMTLTKNNIVILTVVGQGVAPASTISPAHAKALAKRAAVADAYRQMAEKVNGVEVEGRDFIRNMVAQRSEIRTCVQALIKNASVVESRFVDGLFEVEMELRVPGKQWYDKLAY